MAFKAAHFRQTHNQGALTALKAGAYSAAFTGALTFGTAPGGFTAGNITLDGGARVASSGAEGPISIVVRPEAVRISPTNLTADVVLDGLLVDLIYLGVFVKYIVALPGGQRITVHNPDSALRRSLSLNAPVKIGWKWVDQRVIEG